MASPGAAITTDALLLGSDLRLVLGRRELTGPAIGEALVRVEWAGVCGSDLHVLRTGAWVQSWPATLGHEIVGLVESCPGGELDPGTRVVVDSRVSCGRCAGCRQAPNLCENLGWVGEAFPGGFERHLVAPVGSLVVCPASIEAAVAVLAEPLAVAMHALSRAGGPPAGSAVLLIGYGPIGALLHLELNRRRPGTPVTVREPNQARRALAEAFGATVEWRPAGGGDPDPEAAKGHGSRLPLVIDAAGYPGSLADAVASAGNGGTVLIVALGHHPVALLPADVVERALTIVGSNGFDTELPEAVAALDAEPERYRLVITEAVTLEEAPARLAAVAAHPATGKVVIRPWQD
jgi:threonine dehydrogenase-like Zn-dependent dehydrogenase